LADLEDRGEGGAEKLALDVDEKKEKKEEEHHDHDK
jgi:hypothetical protein